MTYRFRIVAEEGRYRIWRDYFKCGTYIDSTLVKTPTGRDRHWRTPRAAEMARKELEADERQQD